MTLFRRTLSRLVGVGGTLGGVKKVTAQKIKYDKWCVKPTIQPLLNDIHHPLVLEYFLRLHMKNKNLEKLQSENLPFPPNAVDGSPFDMVRWNTNYRDELDTAEFLSEAIRKLTDSHDFRESLVLKQNTKEWSETDKELLEMADEDVKEHVESIRSVNGDVDRIMERRLNSEDIVGASSNVWNCSVVGRAGGEEASLFAGELAEAFKTYATEFRGLRVKTTTAEGDADTEKIGSLGFDFEVSGNNVYRYFHHEIGVHKVQRVPVTDAVGKMQTSTATFTMVPVLDPVSVNVHEEDCAINFVRGSGPGGQGMQSSSNCCVLTHKPSGITVKCHQSRSALGNKELALQMVAQRILADKVKQQNSSLHEAFNNQWSSGERSDKMRTYNFPQNRVTDHRLGKDYPLTNFLDRGSGLVLVHDELNALNDLQQLG
ncbi:peptide chain release factor 1 [Angomonas deanei]|nr:peptide chain release factor 1 [Angomonas deanei]|eukprot:EPY43879.1 peptide chain release factor 1 [Angomonas deanei]